MNKTQGHIATFAITLTATQFIDYFKRGNDKKEQALEKQEQAQEKKKEKYELLFPKVNKR